MDLHRIARGTVSWGEIEAIGRVLCRRLDREHIRVEFIQSNNWLSCPVVVDHHWFVKIITPQHARVHTLLTGARNLGAVTSGTPGFFDRFESPRAMAEHEYWATTRLREIGITAPQPIDVFEHNGLGVVVLEYLPEFTTIGDLPTTKQHHVGRELCETLSEMHEHGLVHGDLREENVLIADCELYIIDATSVQNERLPQARSYDIASALGVLAPLIGPHEAVELAVDSHGTEAVLAARRFLEFVGLRPDHELDVGAVKRAIIRVSG